MAEYNSSLSVRTQNPGDVVVKVADATTPSQQQAVNAAGSAQIAGQGIAGTPAGGVVSVQGVSGGTALPVTGTLSITDPAEGPVGSPPPSDAIYIGALVSTSSPSFVTGNLESLSLTLAGALRVDGSAVTQPISGSVSISGTPSINLTEVGGSSISLGQALMAASIPVVLASDQSTIITSDLADGSVSGGTAGTKSMLSGGIYNTTLPTLTNGQQAALQLDSSGKLLVDGSTVTQPVSGTVTANQGGAPWSQNLTQLSGATPSASNSLPVQITTGSSYVSASNPLPVIIDPASAGTPKNYYTDSSSIAAGSNVTQSTTVGGTTGFYVQQVFCAGSGKFKAIVQIETAAGSGLFNVAFVAFNSTATPNATITFPSPTLVATGARIQVIMSNNDLAAQDLYSTVSGFQI